MGLRKLDGQTCFSAADGVHLAVLQWAVARGIGRTPYMPWGAHPTSAHTLHRAHTLYMARRAHPAVTAGINGQT